MNVTYQTLECSMNSMIEWPTNYGCNPPSYGVGTQLYEYGAYFAQAEKPNVEMSTKSPKSKEGKPQYSYASLIRLAISNCPNGKMTLSEIYQYIIQSFPYYKNAGTGWKNSIRHNLSLNKCFTKVARSKDDPGKGSYWAIDYNYSQDDGVIKKKKSQIFRTSPYSPECSSNSSDFNQNAPSTKPIINETVHELIPTVIQQDLKDYVESIVAFEEETVRERCAGPKHRSYTDEYGNYIDQYSEECDYTCYSNNLTPQSQESTSNMPDNYYYYADNSAIEGNVNYDYNAYPSPSEQYSPLPSDAKYFNFPQYQTDYSDSPIEYNDSSYPYGHNYDNLQRFDTDATIPVNNWDGAWSECL